MFELNGTEFHTKMYKRFQSFTKPLARGTDCKSYLNTLKLHKANMVTALRVLRSGNSCFNILSCQIMNNHCTYVSEASFLFLTDQYLDVHTA